MNNLKRVLSLALSGIMLVGMMAVGAGAVNGKDFTDADKIQNSEAVNTLVTLNVINGKDDGSHYDPEGTLTRAEMAKLIVYVLNGGVEPVMSTKATPTYSDIKGHWAEKYIEYCSNLGIIAGQGDGTFNPGGTLTGSQAAKMMLTAMNYNSDVFHFTGADWELSVNSEANKAKLYDGLAGLDASAPISRDNAAQLVYNGILATTMERKWAQNMTDLHITENYELTGLTLFCQKFNGVAYEGILHASGKYKMAGTTLGGGGKFVVDVDKIDNVDAAAASQVDTQFNFDEDLTPLMGQYVKVLYNSKTKVVYGVYNVADSNSVYHTTANNLTINSDNIELDSVTYNKDSGFKVYAAGGADVTATTGIVTNSADKVKLVDNDADGDIDLAIVTPVAVAKVTFVGTDSITLSNKGGDAVLKASNQKTKDMIVYDGIKKDDFVVYHRDMFKDKDVLEKAELAEGEVTGAGDRNGANSADNRYQVNGKWYKVAANLTSGAVYSTPAVGDTMKMVTLENKLYYAEKISGAQSVENLLMLITGYTGDTVSGNTARVLFADGSVKTVSVIAADVSKIDDANVGKLYSFEVKNDGKYALTEATTTAWTDAAGNPTDKMGAYTFVANGALNLTAGTIDTFSIADDAVVFAFAGDLDALAAVNEGRILTGKELKALTTAASGDDSKICSTAKGFFHSETNGLTRASVIAVTLSGDSVVGFDHLMGTSTNNYGYLVSNATYTRENGTYYINMKLWNGEETIDVKWANSSASTVYKNYKKHTVIGYDTKGTGEITNVSLLPGNGTTVTAITKAAITGLDGKDISFTGDSRVYKITGDTRILYVDSNADSAETIGVADGNIDKALIPAGTDDNSTPVYVQNVKYIGKQSGSDYVVELLVYDVDNTLADRDTTTFTPSWGNVAKILVGTEEYLSGNVDLAAGDVVKVTAKAGATVSVAGLIPAANAAAGTISTVTVAAGTTEVFIVPNSVSATIS